MGASVAAPFALHRSRTGAAGTTGAGFPQGPEPDTLARCV